MATPKEQHDARDRVRAGERMAGPDEQDAIPSAPPTPEQQGDGEPENEREIHDRPRGQGSGGSRGSSKPAS